MQKRPSPNASDPEQLSLPLWLLRAFVAIALSGFLGAVAGANVGGTIGMFFLLFGMLPGMVIGAMVGYVAAIVGAAIGGYRGWTYSGGISGFLGGLALYQLTAPYYPGSLLLWFFALTMPAAIVGLAMGYLASKALVDPRSRFGNWLEPLRATITWARLYELPARIRFVLAGANLALLLLSLRIAFPELFHRLRIDGSDVSRIKVK